MDDLDALGELKRLYAEQRVRCDTLLAKEKDDDEMTKETRENLDLLSRILKAIIDETGQKHSATLAERKKQLFSVPENS